MFIDRLNIHEDWGKKIIGCLYFVFKLSCNPLVIILLCIIMQFTLYTHNFYQRSEKKYRCRNNNANFITIINNYMLMDEDTN